jgi:isopenicillin-N epimerase
MRMDHIKVMPPIDTTIPALGRAIRHEWALDRDDLSVNLGSFDATSKTLLVVKDEWRRRMEAQSSRFKRQMLTLESRDAT